MQGKRTSKRASGRAATGSSSKKVKRSTAKRRTATPRATAAKSTAKRSSAKALTAKRSTTKRRTTAPRASSRGAASAAGGKVGSDPKSARQFGGKGDFGVPETGSERNRAYTSANTKVSDPGNAQPRNADRVSGAGANSSGVGSSSGGDVDTDIVGIASAPISQSGPDDRTDGADMISGDDRPSDAFASKQASAGSDGKRDPKAQARGKRRERLPNDATVDRSGGDVSTTDSGQGAGAVTNPMARNDDSFAGEVNMSEASGADNTSSDRQG